MKNKVSKQIDWFQTLVPILSIVALVGLSLRNPQKYTATVQEIRFFLGDKLGWFYILLGIVTFSMSLYLAFSKYGKIRLGTGKSSRYPNWQWGIMIFTSTMSADIIFYALVEWSMYIKESFIQHKAGGVGLWSLTYSLFHWGPIAWSFYIVLAVAFAFMIHVRKCDKQKFSEALRPLLGNRVDGIWGMAVNLVVIFALLAGTATTFSVSMPLLSGALSQVFHIQNSAGLAIVILLIIVSVYTTMVLLGMKAMARLSSVCSLLFGILLAFFFFGGNQSLYILDNGIAAVGNLIQHFAGMTSWTAPLSRNSFTQKWTIYYWSYWMVWCTATPFFIASISGGRTIKELIFGAYTWGLSGTSLAFIVLSNYGLGQYLQKNIKLDKLIDKGDAYVDIGLKIINTLPWHNLVLLILVLTMIGMYATVFESITMVVSTYSYKSLSNGSLPDRKIRAFWAITFIILPIALIFMQQSIYALQSLAIISAFPIGVIIILVMISFFKDAKVYLSK